ncbi:hypothetical protein CLOM_g14242, partial [Closterium sp. NIES-68]
LALLLFVALAVLTPSALARTGLGISSKILASLRGTLNSCGGRGADVRSDTNGIADIRILRRGTSVYLAYKITAQGIAQPPSSPQPSSLATPAPSPPSPPLSEPQLMWVPKRLPAQQDLVATLLQ